MALCIWARCRRQWEMDRNCSHLWWFIYLFNWHSQRWMQSKAAAAWGSVFWCTLVYSSVCR